MKLSRRWSPSWALLCVCVCVLLGHGIDSLTLQDDVNSLLALQNEWKAGEMFHWIGDDPCGSEWSYITCNGANPAQRVKSLSISGLQLYGTLPDDVGGLTALETLDLSYNNLAGTLPTELGKLVNLINLDLQSNKFSGAIPPELGKLTQLITLYLTSNQLQGLIPHEIGYLKNLSVLDISDNGVRGELPYSSDGKNQLNVGLDNLTATKHFHFNNNSLEGSIPSALCHPGMSLIHMILDANQMSGVIPDEIGLCSNLLVLKLDHNKFIGTVPQTVGKLVNLTELYLSSNQLTGELPDLSNLTKLHVLGLSNNKYAPSAFPDWMISLKSLTDLQMENASLQGALPRTFFELPSLEAVHLDYNELNGTLDLSTCTPSLLFVSMRNNQIDSTSLGTFNQSGLHLEGNPVCNTLRGSANYTAICAPVTAVMRPHSYQNSTNCKNQCSISSTLPNPLDCSCAIPYKCHFIFLTPSFTTLSNPNNLRTFVGNVSQNLSISAQQIMVPDAHFNGQNQLFVTAWLFPNPNSERWSPDDIVRISGAAAHIRIPQFGPATFQADPYPIEYWPPPAQRGKLSMGVKIGVAVGATVVGLFVIGTCIFAFVQKHQAKSSRETYPASWGSGKTDSGGGPKLKGARWFSFAELKKATSSFSNSNVIGSGGYGKVYKGELLTKEKVAIKRAEQRSMAQGAAEFKNEIELLSRVHHRNVVGLLGFCFEQGEQMLVYDYIQNGTLLDALYGYSGVELDWHQRLHVALGAARGLSYLHDLACPPIIHRDIKSSNILLDGKLNAKVADFGLSKIGPDAGKTHVTTEVKGTVGYVDPEYYTTHQLTEKSDVYSYGVVLLEMLTARKPIQHGSYIVKEVRALLDKGGIAALKSILDPKLQYESMLEVQSFVQIAMHCVEESSLSRPTMSEVVKEFEEFIGQKLSESGTSAGSSKTFD